MKKLAYLFIAITFIAFSSCSDNDSDPKGAGKTLNYYIDASSKTTWHYFSLKSGKEVGSGEETDVDNKKWFASNDWDFAVCRYAIRTNSGAATSIGSTGGIYTCEEGVKFTALETVPNGAIFTVDKAVEISGHGKSGEIIKSTAQVITFKANEDGSLVMPPVYLQSPVYIFKTADGKKVYKINFTQYINDDGISGHVKFEFAILY